MQRHEVKMNKPLAKRTGSKFELQGSDTNLYRVSALLNLIPC